MMVPYDYLMMSLPDLMMLVVVIITDFSHIWIKSCNPKRSSTRLVCHRAHIFTTYAIQIQVEKSILIQTFIFFSFFSLKYSDVKRSLVDSGESRWSDISYWRSVDANLVSWENSPLTFTAGEYRYNFWVYILEFRTETDLESVKFSFSEHFIIRRLNKIKTSEMLNVRIQHCPEEVVRLLVLFRRFTLAGKLAKIEKWSW